MSSSLNIAVPFDEQEVASKPGWEMKTLKPWHKNLASLLAQGIGREEIAVIMDCTPEYVSMLAKQDKMREYIRDMCQAADLQLESMFVKSVKAIDEVLDNGNSKEKIQAARLQMEATRRIGPRHSDTPIAEDTVNRLTRLSERLLALQDKKLPIIEGEVIHNGQDQIGKENEASNAHEGDKWSHQSAQDDGNGLQDSGR